MKKCHISCDVCYRIRLHHILHCSVPWIIWDKIIIRFKTRIRYKYIVPTSRSKKKLKSYWEDLFVSLYCRGVFFNWLPRCQNTINYEDFKRISTIFTTSGFGTSWGEFYHVVIPHLTQNPTQYFKKNWLQDVITLKEVQVLKIARE